MRKVIKLNGGLNLSPPEEIGDNDLAECKNLCVNESTGFLVKRPGYTLYRTLRQLEVPLGIYGYWRFYKRNGDYYDIYALTTDESGIALVYFKNGGSVSHEIGNFWQTGARVRSLAFLDRRLFCNGVDPMTFFDDEDNYGQMEVAKPREAPSGVVTEWQEEADSRILLPTLIQYKVCYYFDGQPDKKTNTSPLSELVDGQHLSQYGIKKIAVTIPISANERVTGRKVFRRHKAVTGLADDVFGTWEEVKDIDNNIDTEFEDVIDSGISIPELPQSTDVVPISKFMEPINNRVFYGNSIEPEEEAGIGFAYSQEFSITQNEGKTFTNPIVSITLQWNNPQDSYYIKYGDFVGNEGNDFKFMLADAGVVTPLGFKKISFNANAGTVNFKVRIPELVNATAQVIKIYYGKEDMTSLSDWRNLYRKELLYSDMRHFFHMDKFGGNDELYDRASTKKGELHGTARFLDGDGGFYGGDPTQTFDIGKHVQVTTGGAQSDENNGYVSFDKPNDTETTENESLSFLFKLDNTPPTGDDNKKYSLLRGGRDNKGEGIYRWDSVTIFLKYRENFTSQLILVIDGTDMSPEEDPEYIDCPWDGEWHQLFLTWETEDSNVRWKVYLDDDKTPKIDHLSNNLFFRSYTREGWVFAVTTEGETLGYSPRPYHVDTLIWYNRVVEGDEIAKLYLREIYFENAVTVVAGTPYDLREKKCTNRIYWSAEDIPESVPGDNDMDIGSSTALTNLIKLKNNLCTLKKNELRLLSNTDEMAVEYWHLGQNLTGDVKNIGLVAPDSLASIEGAILGLSAMGLFGYDGSQFLFPGRDKVDTYLRDLPRETLETALAKYYAKRNEYWLWVNNRLLVLDLPSGKWTEYDGISPIAFEIWEDDNGEFLFVDLNNKLNKFGEGATDDGGNEIKVTLKTKRFTVEELAPGYEWLWPKSFCFEYDSEGSDSQVDVTIEIDDDESYKYEQVEDGIEERFPLGRAKKIQFTIESSKSEFKPKILSFEYDAIGRR